MKLKIKLACVAVLTVFLGAFLITEGILRASQGGRVDPHVHSAVYHPPTVRPTRIA